MKPFFSFTTVQPKKKAKVSSDSSKARGGNCDTRLDKMDYLKFYNDINAQKQINKLAKKYKNKSVVIYGAGLMSYVLFENFDLSKLNITAVCDAKYKNESSETFFTYKTISPQELQETECDAILICLKEHEKIRQYIKYNLLVNTKNKNIEVQRLLNIPLSFIIKQISG